MANERNERNIEVAKRLGYHVYHYDKGYEDYYQLWDKNGNVVAEYPDCQRKTEAEAWQDAPKCDRDLNLAFKLFDDVTEFLLEKRYAIWYVSAHGAFPRQVSSLEDLASEIVDWWLANVDVKAQEKKRMKAVIQDQMSRLQDQLNELEAEGADSANERTDHAQL